MIKVITKSGNLANLLRCTSSIGATTNLPIVPAVPEEEQAVYPVAQSRTTAYTSAYNLPTKKMRVVTGPTANFSVRFNHTDVKVPNFDSYRRDDRKNPFMRTSNTENSSKVNSGAVVLAGTAASVYATKMVVTTLAENWTASKDVLALAKIEIDKSDVPEGKNVTFKWRGKPLFIRHRTKEEIEKEGKVDLSTLRDPEPDSVRARDPEWLVVIGVCTHLGCVPISHQGDWGGYYCPCHGSHYDAAGRVRKGPAPTNLEIPTYEFVDNKIIVG